MEGEREAGVLMDCLNQGTAFPVNSKYAEAMGKPMSDCHPELTSLHLLLVLGLFIIYLFILN